jgi:hypothetical protein
MRSKPSGQNSEVRQAEGSKGLGGKNNTGAKAGMEAPGRETLVVETPGFALPLGEALGVA